MYRRRLEKAEGEKVVAERQVEKAAAAKLALQLAHQKRITKGGGSGGGGGGLGHGGDCRCLGLLYGPPRL